MTLPVQRYSPNAGLYVDRTGQTTSITGSMELSGPTASAARAVTIQNSINQTWTANFPDGYSVTCNIRVTYLAPGTSASSVTQIIARAMSGPSNVFLGTMTLNSNHATAFTWTAAHEFGHIIGLGDRYSESIMSTLRGRFGGVRANVVEPGYENNIMGVHQGVLESRNLRDSAVENDPSSWWINDDDHVRDWISAHTQAEVGALSAADKLSMIRTLMGYYISDADVDAIVAICASVTTRDQAEVIRNGIDLADFSGHGQRMRVRIAFDNMP